MTRVYVAGPMTGIPDLNFPAFHREASRLRAEGVEVVNPAEINGGADELVAMAGMDESQLAAHWRACMRNDIREMVLCDCIVLLPGWERSKGASLEHYIARQLDMKVVYLVRDDCQAHRAGVAA